MDDVASLTSGSICGVFCFWGAGVAGADPFVDLSALSGGGAGYPYGAADGINDSGQVVGSMSIGGVYSAFLYTSGTVYDLNSQFGNTGTTVTHATGINGAGQISGMWGVPGKTAYYYSGGSAGTGTALTLPADDRAEQLQPEHRGRRRQPLGRARARHAGPVGCRPSRPVGIMAEAEELETASRRLGPYHRAVVRFLHWMNDRIVDYHAFRLLELRFRPHARGRRIAIFGRGIHNSGCAVRLGVPENAAARAVMSSVAVGKKSTVMSHRHPMVLCLLWGLLAGSPAACGRLLHRFERVGRQLYVRRANLGQQ